MAKARSVLRDKAKESFYFGPNTESLKRVSPTGPSAVTAATDKKDGSHKDLPGPWAPFVVAKAGRTSRAVSARRPVA